MFWEGVCSSVLCLLHFSVLENKTPRETMLDFLGNPEYDRIPKVEGTWGHAGCFVIIRSTRANMKPHIGPHRPVPHWTTALISSLWGFMLGSYHAFCPVSIQSAWIRGS